MASRGTPIRVRYVAYDVSAGAMKTGDVANHTVRWLKDGVVVTPVSAPTEPDTVNLPGVCEVSLSASECDCDSGTIGGKSSTAGVVLWPTSYTFEVPRISTGANTVLLIVRQSGGGPLIEGAAVRVTKGAESYVQATDVNGHATFQLDDGTWTVNITKPGFNPLTSTIAVSAGAVYPLFGIVRTAIFPPAAGQVTGYLTTYDVAGAAEPNVTVTVWAIAPPVGSGLAIDTAAVDVLSDSAGLVQVPGLFQGATYSLRRGGGRTVTVLIPVDALSPYQLPNLAGDP